jgi:PD-(D/E)XK endonuclease
LAHGAVVVRLAQVVFDRHGPAESVASLDNMLTTDQKGNIAELAIAAAAIELGIDVYTQAGEGGRYDMIFGCGDSLLRIQCKWAPRIGDTIAVRCYSARRNHAGLVVRKYSQGEIDAFAANCPDTSRCYFLPAELCIGRREVRLRLGPCRNNQRLRINWAKDYEFAATLGSPGAIAQLGERPDGIRKVAGSIPAGSTLFDAYQPPNGG